MASPSRHARSASQPALTTLVLASAAFLLISGCHVEAMGSSRKLMQPSATATEAPGTFPGTAVDPNTPPPTLPAAVAQRRPCGIGNVQITWSCPFNVASLVTPGRRMGLWRFTVTHNCSGPTVLRSLSVITSSDFNTTGANGYLNPLGTAGLVGCSGGTCQLADESLYSGPYFDPSTLQDETVTDMYFGNLDFHNGDHYVFLYQDPTKRCGQGDPQFSFTPAQVEFDGQ